MYPKEVTRWFKALEIAKVLFEEEGYHGLYLKQIDQFIRRKTMYSPRIYQELIPSLYLLAKSKRIPMTQLVNRILKGYLDRVEKEKGEGTNERGGKINS
jgi:hypothetical protein